MVWDKLKNMNLDDKVECHLQNVSKVDSDAVENFILDGANLQRLKSFVHDGYDSQRMGKELGLSTRQVNIILDLIGKL